VNESKPNIWAITLKIFNAVLLVFNSALCLIAKKQQVKPLAINALKINQRGIILKNDKKCSIKSIKGK